jgi:hypothetical protein
MSCNSRTHRAKACRIGSLPSLKIYEFGDNPSNIPTIIRVFVAGLSDYSSM